MLWAWNVDIFVRLDLRGWAPPATHYHFNHWAYQYRHICYLAFWHCPHSMQNRTKRYRVRPSVSFIHPLQQQQHVVGLLLSALLVGDINRLLQLRGMRWWVKPVMLFTYPSVAAWLHSDLSSGLQAPQSQSSVLRHSRLPAVSAHNNDPPQCAVAAPAPIHPTLHHQIL